MAKPTQMSVTDVPCECGYLQRAAEDSISPIKFDTQLNEYNVEIPLSPDGKMSMRLYHCPMCGGVASESKRHTLFTAVTEAEISRLYQEISHLKTVQDIERALGASDEEFNLDAQPVTWPRETIERNGQVFRAVRTVTFRRLSEIADVQFTVFENGEARPAIGPKYIGPLPNAA